MGSLFEIFSAVYFLNTIPAFAPPTWMVLSYVGFNHSQLSPFFLALTGAFAATLGRITLAALSQSIIRNKLLDARTKENIDVLKGTLEQRKNQTVSALFIYSLAPLPSNYLFIAYGLTSLPLRLIALPFFIGRLTSYTVWILLGQEAYKSIDIDAGLIGGYMSAYFVLTQLVVLLLTYLFTKIDWNAILVERRLRWLK